MPVAMREKNNVSLSRAEPEKKNYNLNFIPE